MIPEKLTISGFLSYQEPVEIDFRSLHVACITGQNGAGKSALLDAMTWALFGEARKKDDSIINDVCSEPIARVEFEFSYEGAHYLIRRQKKRGKPNTADFFIQTENGKNWKALTEKGIKNTNQLICNTLHMDYDTFINAAFFLQGRADQFTGQNPTERKRILSTILNLDVWETYKAAATDKRKAAEMSAQQLSGLIGEAEAELADEPERRKKLQELNEKITEAQKIYERADQQWKLAQAAQSTMNSLKAILDQKQRDEAHQSRQVQTLQQLLDTRNKELDTLHLRLANADTIEQRYQQMLSVREQLEKLNASGMECRQLENSRDKLSNTIRSTEKQLHFEFEQLKRDKAELENLLPQRQQLEDELKTIQPELEKLATAWSHKRELDHELETVKSEGQDLRKDIDFRTKNLKEIDTQIEEYLNSQGTVCPTCGREMDAEHCQKHAAELTEKKKPIETELAVMKEEREKKVILFRQLDKRVNELAAIEPRISELKIKAGTDQQKLRMLNERIQTWENGKKERFEKIMQSLQTSDFCTTERQALAEVNEKITALAYDSDEHQRVRNQLSQFEGIEKQHQDLIRAHSQLEPLEREISEKKQQLTEASEHLKTLKEEREKAENDVRVLSQQMPDMPQIQKARNEALENQNRLHQEQGQARQLVQNLEQAKVNLDRYGAEYKQKTALADHYKSLEKAFGKDGIPALLIEQAIPELEEQANKILQQLSSGTMSLRMNTQGAYKSKKDSVKETLDILISDPYGVREYEMFSGGEAFRINFSIRLALSRLLARRSGSRLQTLVIDEGFGSQDDEGRARLAEAITAVQGDFEKILVITHLTELKEAFPSRIEVEKTASGSHVGVIL